MWLVKGGHAWRHGTRGRAAYETPSYNNVAIARMPTSWGRGARESGFFRSRSITWAAGRGASWPLSGLLPCCRVGQPGDARRAYLLSRMLACDFCARCAQPNFPANAVQKRYALVRGFRLLGQRQKRCLAGFQRAVRSGELGKIGLALVEEGGECLFRFRRSEQRSEHQVFLQHRGIDGGDAAALH